MLEPLINYLQSELNISADAISLARRTQTRAFPSACRRQFERSQAPVGDAGSQSGVARQNIEPNILPIVLWQYGLLNTRQLDLVFDWLEVS